MFVKITELDRRFVYLLVLLALSVPLVFKYNVKPARMRSAEKVFEVIKSLERSQNSIAFIVMDFGPNSMAENLPQSEVVIEHLMRKRIPYAVYSQYALAETFMESIPAAVAAKLMHEMPGEKWEYGVDWVNLGYRPGASVMIQNIGASNDLISLLKKDARGNNLDELSAFRGVKTLKNIVLMAHFSSLVGTLDTLLQFFKATDYRPDFVHGCTSITIPQAFIYLDSGQLVGLLEGIAGAAWYSQLLMDNYPNRIRDSSQIINTGLGVAHLVIIALVCFGNVAAICVWRRK